MAYKLDEDIRITELEATVNTLDNKLKKANDLINELRQQINKNDLSAVVSNRTCVTCLYCQANPSSEFIHDRHKCTLSKNIVTITNAVTHTCDDWTEIPF